MNNLLEKHQIPLVKDFATCYVYDFVKSTFDTAYTLLDEGNFSEWSSVLAFSQSSGRGQLGHNWSSPVGNLSATIRIPKNSVFDCDAIAPIFGSILINFLKNNFDSKKIHTDTNFSLKWTNDLLINYQNNYFKIGGILAEERKDALFIGIGINIHSKPNYPLDNNTFPLPAKHLEEFYTIENNSILSLWFKLVHFINVCYFLQSSNVKNLTSKDALQAVEIKNNFLQQKEFLKNSNTHLAFKGMQVQINNAIAFEALDYSTDGTLITDYTGILKEISLDKSTLGGIVIETQYGTKTFISGSIRLY